MSLVVLFSAHHFLVLEAVSLLREVRLKLLKRAPLRALYYLQSKCKVLQMATVILSCENEMWIYGSRTIADRRKCVSAVSSVAVQYVHP